MILIAIPISALIAVFCVWVGYQMGRGSESVIIPQKGTVIDYPEEDELEQYWNSGKEDTPDDSTL